jgi:peptidoglycan hydrolase-like protein with peptidoglycan-binding domain
MSAYLQDAKVSVASDDVGVRSRETRMTLTYAAPEVAARRLPSATGLSVRAERHRLPTEAGSQAAPIAPPVQLLLTLQRAAGNVAVSSLLAQRSSIEVQRCGPAACNCSDEERAAPTPVVQRQVEGPCQDIETEHVLIKRSSVHPAVREAQRKLNQHSDVLEATGGTRLPKTPLVPDCVFGQNTRDAVVAFQQEVFPDDPRQWDGMVGDKTWTELDRVAGATAPVNPAPTPGPGTGSDAEKMATARDASRTMTDIAILKVTAMADAFRLGLMDAVPELRGLHAPTIKAVETWLRVQVTDLPTFLAAADSALGLMKSARGVDGAPRRATTGECNSGDFARAVPGDTGGPVICCDLWFQKGPQCRRNTMTHERFHLAGVVHGESPEGFIFPAAGRTTEEALNSADDLTDLVKHVAGEAIVACATGA